MDTRISNGLERPPSEQLSDLHIYVIPGESWNEKFRSAYNEVINESVSAGFVRVVPDITVYALRDEIEEQLGNDDIPKDYVFLKSVGRCLTQVKGRQEIDLKVKSFLPPMAYLPEIFLLPGQREHVPLALPSTENYKAQRHKHSRGGRSSKNESTQTGPLDTINSNSRIGDVDSYSHLEGNNSSPDPFSLERYPPKSTNPDDRGHHEGYLPPLSATPPQTPDVVPGDSPQQRRTKVPLKGSPNQNRSGRSDTYTNNTNEDSGIADDVEEELERKRREQEDEERRRREEQDRLRRLEDQRRQVNEQRRLEEEEQQNRIREEEDRRRREIEEQEMKRRLEDVERQARERLRDQEEERLEREREELERQRSALERLQEEQRERERREQDRRAREEMQRRQQELEDQLREEEERKKLEEERRRKELQEKQQKPFVSPPPLRVPDKRLSRDSESARERDLEEKERLLEELQRARDERQDMEREREDLVKRAKSLQSKTQHRRNQARDMWKKKYFEEKKKTPPLEEQVNKLRHSLDVQHKKLVTQLEGKDGKRKNLYSNPSEKTNLKITIAKSQHDIEELRRRVENTKMKLTTEMKLRNQAETELRALRAELTQKKINVTLSRSQQLAALKESEENLSYMSPRTPLPSTLSPRVQ